MPGNPVRLGGSRGGTTRATTVLGDARSRLPHRRHRRRPRHRLHRVTAARAGASQSSCPSRGRRGRSHERRPAPRPVHRDRDRANKRPSRSHHSRMPQRFTTARSNNLRVLACAFGTGPYGMWCRPREAEAKKVKRRDLVGLGHGHVGPQACQRSRRQPFRRDQTDGTHKHAKRAAKKARRLRRPGAGRRLDYLPHLATP